MKFDRLMIPTIAFAAAVFASAAIGQTPSPAPALPQTESTPPAGAVARGQALFALRCQACHDPAVEDAPAKSDLATFAPGFIVDTLKNGDMRPRAQGLSDDDIDAIAIYLTAR